MLSLHTIPLSFSLLSLAVGLGAQIPVGSAAVGAIGGSTTPLVLVDRAGAGTVLSGAALADINALRVDPINGALWMVSSANGEVRRGFVAGNQVIADTLVGSVPLTSVSAIGFDSNMNPVVGGGTITSTGGVWIVDRHTGQTTQIIDAASGIPGLLNAIDEDPILGDIYFGTFGGGAGNVYKISPPYTLNSQTLVGTTSTTTTSISGISFFRDGQSPLGALLISCFAGANSIQRLDVLTGLTTVVPGTPPWSNLNWVDHDSVNGEFWTIGTGSLRNVYVSDLAGVNNLLYTVGSGTTACVEVNAVNPNSAWLRVAPRLLPVPPAPITLELSVAGKPGDIAVFAIVSPLLASLAQGTIGADGRFSIAVPNLVVLAGNPGVLSLQAATLDQAAPALKLSNTVSWPQN